MRDEETESEILKTFVLHSNWGLYPWIRVMVYYTQIKIISLILGSKSWMMKETGVPWHSELTTFLYIRIIPSWIETAVRHVVIHNWLSDHSATVGYRLNGLCTSFCNAIQVQHNLEVPFWKCNFEQILQKIQNNGYKWIKCN